MMYNDVKKDVDFVFESLSSEERLVPSAFEAIKLSAIFPLSCLSFYALSLAYIIYSFVPPDDVWINPTFHYQGLLLAFGGFTLILSLAIMAMTYTPFLLLTSIPKEVRAKSLMVKRLSGLCKTVCIIAIVINALVALLSALNSQFFYAAPFVLLLSYLIMQAMVSSELTRYGIAGAMSKLTKLVKKI